MHHRIDHAGALSTSRRTARSTAGYPLHRRLAKGVYLAALTAVMILGTLLITATLAQAQDCRRSSYIPGLRPLILQHMHGTTMAIQRHSRNYRPTARLWINGNYVGEHEVPFDVAGGEIQVRLRTQQRLETWLGSVRQAYKPVPYLVVCGPWLGNLP